MSSSKRETRYQVFISSPFKSLENERKRAIEGVMEAGHIPVALERFTPSSATDLEVIDHAINDSQIYIAIVGHRCGSKLKEDQKAILKSKYPKMKLRNDITYTEVEYQIAVNHGLMVLTFVMEVSDAQKMRDNEYEKTKDEDIHTEAKHINAFVNEIKGFKQYWKRNESSDLKGMVNIALYKNEDKCKKEGFVKELADEASQVFKNANENTFIIDIVRKLTEFEKFNKRTRIERAKKEAAAIYFKQEYLEIIRHKKMSLFFESGSTVAYAAKELGCDLNDSNIDVSSNNIAAFLHFMLVSQKSILHWWPWSPPQEPYGASYGDITRIPSRLPNYANNHLCDFARKIIDDLLQADGSIAKIDGSVLMLGAASGMQIQDYNFVEDNRSQDARDRVEEQIQSNCAGPHLSSYHNKIFKCFMFKTGKPIMYFITEEKVDSPIRPGHCHFIIETKKRWNEILKEYPIGFCVGCDTSTVETVAEKFESLGMEVMRGPDSMAMTAIIARNKPFIKLIES